MKPRILTLVLAAMVVLAVTLCPAPASAQVDARIVNIPFNFHLNNTAYPAGKYELTYTGQPHWYLLRSADFKAGRLMYANNIEMASARSSPGLVFHRYGNVYFLAQVWLGEHGGQLSKSRMETEVATQWGKGTDNTVVQALKK
ncbi:MAG: hypothetical protein WCC59_18770 [Terriglobales bacterium]